jgi:hypothetical protein
VSPQRKLEWEAERRFLLAEKHRIETRLAELDEILRLLFPKEAA